MASSNIPAPLTLPEFFHDNEVEISQDSIKSFREWAQPIQQQIKQAAQRLLNAEAELNKRQELRSTFQRVQGDITGFSIKGGSVIFNHQDNIMDTLSHRTIAYKILKELESAAQEAHVININVRGALAQGGFLYRIGAMHQGALIEKTLRVEEVINYSFISLSVDKMGHLTTALKLNGAQLKADIIQQDAFEAVEDLTIDNLDQRSTVWSAVNSAVDQIQSQRESHYRILYGRRYEVYNQVKKSILGGNHGWSGNDASKLAEAIQNIVNEVLPQVLRDNSNTYIRGDIEMEGTILEEKYASAAALGLTSINNIRNTLLSIYNVLSFKEGQEKEAMSKLKTLFTQQDKNFNQMTQSMANEIIDQFGVQLEKALGSKRLVK